MNSQDSTTGYAYWISPDGSSKVVYSLAAFGDIDATVSDGYRRIPRGGVETAGILFGTRKGNELQIETTRPIECQHAFGPSFILSDTDRNILREQLDAASRDSELAEYEPLGWYIGHTRSPLSLSDREVEWFNEFFPKPGSVVVLVKPERFQPTRFAFIVRDPLGQLRRESPSEAVILPLSTQSGAPAAPAISAPVETPPEVKPEEPKPAPIERSVEKPFEAPRPAAAEKPVEKTNSPAPPRSEVTRVRVPAAPAPPPPLVTPYKKEPSDGTQPNLEYPYASLARTRVRAEERGFGGFGLQSIAVLVIAAVLGCLAGYWAYLQLPSPVIPVSVREQNNQLIVEWPATQTAGVDYAALQVNDGPWLTLSTEQKDQGRAVITPPPGDLKIDLVAKHWLRDSRGIVRYIRTPNSAPR